MSSAERCSTICTTQRFESVAGMLWKTPILMYHSVYVDRPHRGGVHRDTLEAHFQWLARHGMQGVPVWEHLREPAARNVCLTFDDGYMNNLAHVLPLLGAFGFKATFFVCARLEGQVLDWHVDDPQPLMGPDGWRELARHGHEVASHGLTHRRVDQLDMDQSLAEITESKARLEEVVGPVGGYAYPQGYFNHRVLKIVRRTYAYACTTRPRGRLFQDRWTLKRVNIGPDDDSGRFVRKMSLAFRLACDLGY
jgi:peptidoglycan/xylan/chitin deacetylase (PgdA/CDA1 family)